MSSWLNKIPGSSIMRINYGEHILKSIIATKYAKTKLSVLMMMIFTTILRFHLVSVIGTLISVNMYVDFVTQVTLGVIFVLHTNKIYNLVVLNKDSFYRLTRYLINNYTPERYRNWRRCVTITIALYIIVVMMFVEITSNLVILYTIQYIVSYLIIDIIEQRRVEKMMLYYKDKPDKEIYAEFNIINSFYDIPEDEKKFLKDDYYDKIDTISSKKTKSTDSLGKIGFVLIDDYH